MKATAPNRLVFEPAEVPSRAKPYIYGIIGGLAACLVLTAGCVLSLVVIVRALPDYPLVLSDNDVREQFKGFVPEDAEVVWLYGSQDCNTRMFALRIPDTSDEYFEAYFENSREYCEQNGGEVVESEKDYLNLCYTIFKGGHYDNEMLITGVRERGEIFIVWNDAVHMEWAKKHVYPDYDDYVAGRKKLPPPE